MNRIPPKRVLPSKEASLFKELLSLYETRQLKKGIKTADQILKKFPEHGETFCMKGLILTHMGRREEGIDLVKKGVRLDLTSHICWHVFGLTQKAEKNYEEALKSYTQALRFDKDNLNILRDAGHLQTQLRMYDALVETRDSVLRVRPAVRQHWIALAVAYHLSGNLVQAKNILEQYESGLKNIPDYDVDHSETLLYHIRLLEDLNKVEEALAFLDVNAKSRSIVDKTAIMEIRARLLSKIGHVDAEHAWRVLVEHNPDCNAYYDGYLANQKASPAENPSLALAILEEFSSQIPKSNTPRRLALNLASGEKFKELAKPYILTMLKKGVPSLFADIKSLYTDDGKRQAVEEIVEAARAPPSTSTVSSEPTMYLWILYFLGQHYSYLGQLEKALQVLDLAIDHTPTLPELYTCRARILKRAGNYIGAAMVFDEARRLDGQDRFLNTKTGKYRLRAGLIDEANKVLGLFTKKDAASPSVDLEDMQSLLYLTEEANARYRNEQLHLALKRYAAIQKIFDEMEDDQFDFHGYSIRKYTLNTYIDILAWEDALRTHPAYVNAALNASRIFVAVYDRPSLAKVQANSNAEMTDAEKKAKKKAKKAAQKEKDKEQDKKTVDEKFDTPAPKDDDPEGLKLIACSDPLERAMKFLNPLLQLTPDNIDIWIALYDVAVRRRKMLQAVNALLRVKSLDADNPELHLRIVDMKQLLSSLPQTPPEPIGSILEESLSKLLPAELTLELFNSQYLQKHSQDPASILAAAKIAYKLKCPLQEVEDTVFTVFGPDVKCSIKMAIPFMLWLKEIDSGREAEFKKICCGKFPLSTVFLGSSELEVMRKEAVELAVNGPKIDSDVVSQV